MKPVIEAYIKRLEAGKASIEEMKEVLCYLRHERLIHLLVTIATGMLWIVSCYMMVVIPFVVNSIIFLVLTALFLLYIHYYCYLENSVQRLSNETLKLIEKEDKAKYESMDSDGVSSHYSNNSWYFYNKGRYIEKASDRKE